MNCPMQLGLSETACPERLWEQNPIKVVFVLYDSEPNCSCSRLCPLSLLVLCGGIVRVWAALKEGRMLVGEGACGDAWVWEYGRDGLKENLNKFHKILERLVGVPEEMTTGVKRLYQTMNYG
jgi:hypothetical protein